ncbi:MAG: Nif3-like dinuclear metal center hexameric protein [Gemmatimonadaceae bacterium]|nr:Nif3-like dinuclear metal center hexameric protein [Gemmatimonadaceae bacterium]MDQ3518273.1 Nif3-like dinuclear metal center hexameric protein [Gemmatimonadota bacterium]
MPSLASIAQYLDALLRVSEFQDYPNAVNGVQVDSDSDIVRVAAAVDAREKTILLAVERGANLLLVHHGLFWGGVQPLTGPYLRRIRALLDSRVALYSSHLPLDAHPELGNNVLLARELGLRPTHGFARTKGVDIGVMGDTEMATQELTQLAHAFAQSHGGVVRTSYMEPGRLTRRWAICTGAGASSDTIREATERGVDTLIVGEGPHHTAIEGEENGIVVIYAGHYATETLGVQALARHVSQEFSIPWVFLQAPTGI